MTPEFFKLYMDQHQELHRTIQESTTRLIGDIALTLKEVNTNVREIDGRLKTAVAETAVRQEGFTTRLQNIDQLIRDNHPGSPDLPHGRGRRMVERGGYTGLGAAVFAIAGAIGRALGWW